MQKSSGVGKVGEEFYLIPLLSRRTKPSKLIFFNTFGTDITLCLLVTTIINWVKKVGKLLPDYYDPETIPDVGELDELETFVG
jgi:hypothetical protein